MYGGPVSEIAVERTKDTVNYSVQLGFSGKYDDSTEKIGESELVLKLFLCLFYIVLKVSHYIKNTCKDVLNAFT